MKGSYLGLLFETFCVIFLEISYYPAPTTRPRILEDMVDRLVVLTILEYAGHGGDFWT